MNIDGKIIDGLFGTALFRNIDKEGILEMLPCLNPRVTHHKKGDHIANSGAPFYGIGIVIEGEIVIAKESIAGNRTILTVLKKGDMFGEMISFSDKKAWPV
ncbi:MAG TPA: transcriptional regulator, partial [Clostridiales bacterium UBA8960]|nr:transcriptional regulator [Clostridiales bacterium UBA8960]